MIHVAVTSFITFMVILNPPGTAVEFAVLSNHMTAEERKASAKTACVMAGVILLLFALVGKVSLSALGIGVPAFRIAGGVLLFLLAAQMVFGSSSGGQGIMDLDAQSKKDITIFPLAFPLIAGPGAMTSVILLMGRAEGDAVQGAVIVAMLMVALALVLGFLLQAGLVARVLGNAGCNVVARVMGIVLAALAVQFMIDGAHDVMTAWQLAQ